MVLLNNPRDKSVRNNSFVLPPVIAILLLTHVIISNRSMHQQYREIYRIIIRHNTLEPAKHTPTQPHNPIPRIINLTRHAPPPARQQLRTPLRLQIRQMGHLRRIRISSERILLPVRTPEYQVPQNVHAQYRDQRRPLQHRIVIHQIPRLQTIRERNPRQIPEHEHESESIRGNVHGGQYGAFLIQGIPHVYSLEDVNENHGSGHVSHPIVLFR
mmetsp:Transcript_34863/g.73525  ORF Transcript_34863/g.73525 Transcript_34863/m.73525 type:complete len:214 (+) Transcript_34863:2643-3284(+)